MQQLNTIGEIHMRDNRRNGGGGGGFAPRKRFAPVKVGDILDVKIEAVGEKGDGVAKKDGFVLFVPNTKEGQEVKIKVTRVLSKVGFAEVVGAGEASSEEGGSEEQQEESAGSEESYDEDSGSEEAAPSPEDGKDSEDFGDEDQ